jgi:hypothetical protein
MLKIDLEANRTSDTLEPVIKSIGEVIKYDSFTPEDWRNMAWKRCVQGIDGTVYFPNGTITRDGGLTVEKCDNIFSSEDIKDIICYICEPGFFFMVYENSNKIAHGKFQAKAMWSYDDLATVEKGIVNIELPGKGREHISNDNWERCNFFGGRGIQRLPDGRLLCAVYSRYDDEELRIIDIAASIEAPKYKQHTLIIVSDDNGKNWQLHSIAGNVLKSDPVGEGFNEASIAMLNTGEMMCVMRTGHYYPFYCAWSSDEGVTWTHPSYMGMERACAPCLLKMSDGKLVLAYGNRYPVGTTPRTFHDQIETCMFNNQVKLAVSKDGRGRQWIDMVIGYDLGTTYVSVMEVEPNVLLCQTDAYCWRVELYP